MIRTGDLTTVPKISCVFEQSTGPGIAIQGELADYPRTSSPLKFARNSSQATCDFPMVNDTTPESIEYLWVSLVGPPDAALTLPTTIFIFDNDGFAI